MIFNFVHLFAIFKFITWPFSTITKKICGKWSPIFFISLLQIDQWARTTKLRISFSNEIAIRQYFFYLLIYSIANDQDRLRLAWLVIMIICHHSRPIWPLSATSDWNWLFMFCFFLLMATTRWWWPSLCYSGTHLPKFVPSFKKGHPCPRQSEWFHVASSNQKCASSSSFSSLSPPNQVRPFICGTFCLCVGVSCVHFALPSFAFNCYRFVKVETGCQGRTLLSFLWLPNWIPNLHRLVCFCYCFVGTKATETVCQRLKLSKYGTRKSASFKVVSSSVVYCTANRWPQAFTFFYFCSVYFLAFSFAH